MPLTLEQMQHAGQVALQMLDQLASNAVPRSFKEAKDGQWLAALGSAGAEIMGKMNEGEAEKWSTRVIDITKAQQLFRAFENEMVFRYTKSVKSVWQRTVARTMALPRLFLTHAADFYSVVMPLALATAKKAGDMFATSVIGTFANYLYALDPTWEEMRDLSEAAGENLEKDIEPALLLGAALIASVAYISAEELLMACATADALAQELTPSTAIRDFYIEAAKANAMPQRKRVAVRRRKRAR